jgi:hypothetical protein
MNCARLPPSLLLAITCRKLFFILFVVTAVAGELFIDVCEDDGEAI